MKLPRGNEEKVGTRIGISRSSSAKRTNVNIQLFDREPVLALVKSSLEVSAGWVSVSCCLRRAGSDVVPACPIRPKLPVCPVMM
jgi:hypothetical protein